MLCFKVIMIMLSSHIFYLLACQACAKVNIGSMNGDGEVVYTQLNVRESRVSFLTRVSSLQSVRGGELSLFRKGTAGSGSTFTNLIQLAPAENMLITFQGDIPHQ